MKLGTGIGRPERDLAAMAPSSTLEVGNDPTHVLEFLRVRAGFDLAISCALAVICPRDSVSHGLYHAGFTLEVEFVSKIAIAHR